MALPELPGVTFSIASQSHTLVIALPLRWLHQSFRKELVERARLEKEVAVQHEQIAVLRQKAAAHEAVIEELRIEVGTVLD